MLSRERLVDRLSTGKGSRLIVISGGAGSGKTSLACEWIRKEKLSVAWYSLDETDNELNVFFRYLLTALNDADSGFASTIRRWLPGQKTFSGKSIVPFLIQCLTHLTKDTYLVLDDYHRITSEEIHNLISYLLDNVPPRMHIVFITRYSLPFSIARFKIRNQVIEIPAEEMNFTEKETERFFTEIMSFKLSSKEVQEVVAYTEGWIGGMQLFGLSLKERDTFQGPDRIMNRAFHATACYLVDEVINIQPENVKNFLNTTALIERFNADICRELTGLSDVEGILDYVYRNNMFLIPLDAERTWYRYHNLFSAAIRQRIRLSSPNVLSDINRKAALWFARNNYMEDAFRHAFATEDYEFAADLMEDHLTKGDDYPTVLHECCDIAFDLRWLAKLPRETVARRPLIWLHECCLKIESFQFWDIEATLSSIKEHQGFELYQGVKRGLARDLSSYLRYVLPYYRDLANTNSDSFDAALLGTISPENKLLSGMMKATAARYHLFQANISAASDAIREASTIVFSSNSTWAKLFWFWVAADVERSQGHLYRAEAILEDGFQFLEQSGISNRPMKFMLCMPMAWISYLRNDIEKALEHGSTALRDAEQTRILPGVVEGNILLASIYIATGEADKVDKSIQQIRAISRGNGNPNLIFIAEASIAYLSAIRGDFEFVESWADQRKLAADEPLSYFFFIECLAQAMFLYWKGRHQDAANLLEGVRGRCANRNLWMFVLEMDILRSATYYALGDLERAKMIMEQALAMSEAEGSIRRFVDYAPTISGILVHMAERPPRCQRLSHLSTIMEACSIRNDHGRIPKRFRPANLTSREIEMLKMITAGYKYREIAEKAFVSLETVKTHTKHIYEKLNVKTRFELVKRADELLLFESQ
jgi:LuxR family maltose regulon positive regulatory protein